MPQNFPDGILVSKGAAILDSGSSEVRIRLDGDSGRVVVSHLMNGGVIEVHNSSGKASIWLLGNDGSVVIQNVAYIGPGLPERVFELNGNTQEFIIRSTTTSQGEVEKVLRFDGHHATLHIGGDKHLAGTLRCGNIVLKHEAVLNGAVFTLGAEGQMGRIYIKDIQNHTRITLDGQAGDIVLDNGDCAEDFESAGQEDLDPGTVVVVDADGKVCSSSTEYDHNVIGVVSGAEGRSAGIILGRRGEGGSRATVALIGKVYCKVTAEYGSIRAGAALTTSRTVGHAMASRDSRRGIGAILGKALRPLSAGKAQIPILVTLQ